MKNILLAGGSGLLGKHLTQILQQKGYQVGWLSRQPKSSKTLSFIWDINKNYIDPKAIDFADVIINLAGAGIADKRWTNKRKKDILYSRTESTKLLYRHLSHRKNHIKLYINASACGYYGNRGAEVLHEKSGKGKGFLSNVCQSWEKQAQSIAQLNIRTVILRIGVVLTGKGGALKKMDATLPLGFLSYLGDGNQYLSWIHIDDLCRLLVYSIENESIQGIYNATAPEPVDNKTLIKAISENVGKEVFFLKSPRIALRTIMGEMSTILLEGQRCSSDKIINTGFIFNYPQIDIALSNIYKKNPLKYI